MGAFYAKKMNLENVIFADSVHIAYVPSLGLITLLDSLLDIKILGCIYIYEPSPSF